MKKTTLCCMLLSLLLTVAVQRITALAEPDENYPNLPGLTGNLSWESVYYSFDRNSSLANSYRLLLSSSENRKESQHGSPYLHHTGIIRNTANKRFNRSSYHHNYRWNVGNTYSMLNQSALDYALIFIHSKAADEAKPDTIRYEISKTRKLAGIDLTVRNDGQSSLRDFSLFPPDEEATDPEFHSGVAVKPGSTSYLLSSQVFYVRSEEENTNENTASAQPFNSDGYQLSNRFNLLRNLSETDILLDAFIDQLSADYDYHRKYGLLTSFRMSEPSIETSLSFDKQTRKIYLLTDTDNHVRTNYTASFSFQRYLAKGMKAQVSNQFNVRDNKLIKNRARNYLETENLANINTSYHIWRFNFFNNGSNRTYRRMFKGDTGNRIQNQNSFMTGISYRHNATDSLVFSRKLTLTATDYTVSSKSLDNDQLSDETQVSLYWLYRNRIRVINHFNYTKRDDIYIKAEMSANNRTIKTYNLLPSVIIRFTDYVSFRQDYHLRADYDDYFWRDWELKPPDRMYRKFSSAYSLLTDFPFTTGYRSSRTGNPSAEGVSFNLRYIYDTNNSGVSEDGKQYELYAENEYHTVEFDLTRRFSRIHLRGKPRFVWSNDRYEFNHIFDFNYILPHNLGNSILSVNPSGKNLNNLLWRINFQFRFEW